jgi:glycosyltransferase involved in cell wall biosynthesis
MKILEAPALARAVVSTRLEAEGLALVEGKEIILADDPPAFGEAVVRLFSDDALRRQLGRAARSRVEAAYSPRVLRRQLGRALAHIPASSNGAGREAHP